MEAATGPARILTEDDLVAGAIAARQEAEATEEEASPSRWREADCYAELSDRGWKQQQIARACDTTQSTVSKFIACAREYSVPNNRPTFWGAYREVDGAKGNQPGNDAEWYTPPEYIAAARAVMGGIDLDPATTAAANKVVQAEAIWTASDDALRRDWEGRIWLNPPYGRPLIDGFCGKLAESFSEGAVTQACVLVNNATETGWFHALAEVAAALCFPRQRVKFWNPDKPPPQPLQGQAVVYLGPNADAFLAEFVRFGFTAVLA